MAIRSLSARLAPNPNTTDSAIGVGSESTVASQWVSNAWKRLLAIGCLSLVVAGSSGCTMTSGACRSIGNSECIDDFMIGYRNRALAEKAWHRNKHRFCDHRYKKEFKDGFIQGYMEVASGGNGCIPAIAPSNYWGWRYQSAHGQAAVNAWFEGFPMGVQAAEQDGVGHWQQVRPTGMAPAPAPFVPTVNGDISEVTNPFYSEQEFIPVPVPEPEADDSKDIDDFENVPAVQSEEVFNGAFQDFPVVIDDEPELVSQFEIAKRHEEAGAATFADQPDESPEAAAVVIDDIFGSSAQSVNTDSDELPFSFE
jgi:hypothetical protein